MSRAEQTVVFPEVLVKAQALAVENYNFSDISLLKFTSESLDTPLAVTLLPQSLNTDRGSMTLHDALSAVAGVTLDDRDGNFSGDILIMRDFRSRDDLFLDGLRDSGHYHRDTFNIEQVEVFKGPVATIFGRGSGGGVVNQQSKAPQTSDITNTMLTAGSDHTTRITGDINRNVGENTSVRFNFLAHESMQDRYGLALAFSEGFGTANRNSLSYLRQTDSGVLGNTKTDILSARFDRDFSEAASLHQQLRYSVYSQENLNESALDYDVNLIRKVSFHSIVLAAEAVRENQNSLGATTLAASIADTMNLSAKWEWTEQLRFDYMESAKATESRTDNQMLSSRGGLVYKPIAEASVYLTYATSFNPSVDLALPPEKNRIYELGSKWQLNPELQLTGAVFNNEKIDVQRIHGYEVFLSGAVLERWQLITGFTSTDAPGSSFTFWGTYQAGADCVFGAGAKATDYYTVFDLMARYRMDPKLSFRVNVNNLNDSIYFDVIHLGNTVPATGRSLLLTGELIL